MIGLGSATTKTNTTLAVAKPPNIVIASRNGTWLFKDASCDIINGINKANKSPNNEAVNNDKTLRYVRLALAKKHIKYVTMGTTITYIDTANTAADKDECGDLKYKNNNMRLIYVKNGTINSKNEKGPYLGEGNKGVINCFKISFK
jgi:hypothetical protein